jgi:uncharacterized membrane protein
MALGLDTCQPQRQGPPTHWRLLRNCRLRPAELLAWCCAPGLLALLVAVPFLLQGYTWIAAFALLQLPCLVLAVLSCGVHALDGELISITGGRLRLEQRRGWRVQSHDWPLHSVRLLPMDPDVPAPGLLLLAGGARHVVGRQRPVAELEVIARQLRQALAPAAPRPDE